MNKGKTSHFFHCVCVCLTELGGGGGGGELRRFVNSTQKDFGIAQRVGLGGNECNPLPV